MRIKTGFTGYKMAAEEAFVANISNPGIKYDPNSGFYVESTLIPTTSSHVSLGQVYFNLNRGGHRSAGNHSQYIEAKTEIIRALEGDDAADDFCFRHMPVPG